MKIKIKNLAQYRKVAVVLESLGYKWQDDTKLTSWNVPECHYPIELESGLKTPLGVSFNSSYNIKPNSGAISYEWFMRKYRKKTSKKKVLPILAVTVNSEDQSKIVRAMFDIDKIGITHWHAGVGIKIDEKGTPTPKVPYTLVGKPFLYSKDQWRQEITFFKSKDLPNLKIYINDHTWFNVKRVVVDLINGKPRFLLKDIGWTEASQLFITVPAPKEVLSIKEAEAKFNITIKA